MKSLGVLAAVGALNNILANVLGGMKSFECVGSCGSLKTSSSLDNHGTAYTPFHTGTQNPLKGSMFIGRSATQGIRGADRNS